MLCSDDTLEADPAMKDFVRGATAYAGDDDRTAREFVLAIDDLLKSESKLSGESGERRAFAESHYSWKHAAAQYLEIASRLVSTAGEVSR